MIALLRHLLAIALLPFMVAVVVPVWIARRNAVSLALGGSAGELALQVAGIAAGAVGLALFAASLRRFAVEGDGTLAPWDPPRQLVVTGPYRFVRNPMISGVIFVLVAEALVLGSERYVHFINGSAVIEYGAASYGGEAVSGHRPELKPDGEPLGQGYIALQSEGHPIQFRRVELLNLKGCMDDRAPNFKAHFVEPDPGACR